MKIEDKRAAVVRLKDLNPGEVFAFGGEGTAMPKVEAGRGPGTYVRLGDGSLLLSHENTEVIRLNAKVVIEP